MASTRTFTRSFGGGIIGPEMFGRIDDAKYQTGAAVLRNFIATPQGPAENRPGFTFVNPTKNNGVARLIPFTYSTDQTMVIEMGAGYFRFHTQGATLEPPALSTVPAYIYTTVVTISVASPCVVTWPAHQLFNGAPVQFSVPHSLPGPPPNSLPAGISAGVTYYVYRLSPDTFNISNSLNGAMAGGDLVNTTSPGSGQISCFPVYALGDLVQWTSGTTTRIYYRTNAYTSFGAGGSPPPSAGGNAYWYEMDPNAYEVPNSYAAADLFSIHYVQSADVMTLVHPNYPPQELSRQGATSWTLNEEQFAPDIAPPDNVVATASPGFKSTIASVSIANPALITTASNHTLALGDQIYIDGLKATIGGSTIDQSGYYLVQSVPVDTSGNLIKNELTVMDYSGNTLNSSTWTSWSGPAYIELANKAYDPYSHYVVTAIAQNGIDESVVSPTVSALNNLDVSGSYNTITWSAEPDALRYRVYKQRNGLFGFIGETTAVTFVDDNIAADFSITPPNYDTVFEAAGDYPGAVSYYEQRKAFAGTINEPEGLWMSNSGTESSFSYSIPTVATDRIAIRVAAREANTIRHIVPLTRLILMTSAAEWAVIPMGADVITPTSISVQPQSYVGANNVQPTVVNNLMVFCAARGGHVRELGYSWQANSFVTGDLSLRATQLFDNLTIVDQAYSKAPRPILWFVSSSGVLLGLTYVPEEQIGSWHFHDTQGLFESATCVAEGNEDVLYAVINRTINGATVRYVERLSTRLFPSRAEAIFMDSAISYDGTDVGDTVLMIGYIPPSWHSSSYSLPITASAPMFASTDVGAVLILTLDNGTTQKVTISVFDSPTMVECTVATWTADLLRGRTVTSWVWARTSFGGIDHLEGEMVVIMADGACMPNQVVTGGQITLNYPATIVHVGLPYICDLQTLPLVLQIDGYGQGRTKNINKAWIKVWLSSGIFIGPDEDHLIEAKQRTTEPYGSPPALQTDEIMVMTTPAWQQSGQILIRQPYPLPLTVVSLTLEVAIGG